MGIDFIPIVADGAWTQIITCCFQGFDSPPADAAVDETEAVVLATQWSRKMAAFRELENSTAETDELGLRRVSKISPGPTLGHYVSRK